MKERRMFEDGITATPDGRNISGYAVVFNSESRDLGGFTEIISPSALDGVIAKSDVLCLLNHNEDKGVLARSNKGSGSLSLEVDEKGLRYSFEAPNTSLGNELLEGLKRGDISASSFAFRVGKDRWDKRSDGSYVRTIVSIDRMFDVSPVYCAAYDSTTVEIDKRGLYEMKETEKKEMEEYYNKLKEEIK